MHDQLSKPVPAIDQRVEVRIRGAEDLLPRVGTVTTLDDAQAYVTNVDDYVGVRPGVIWGHWVNAAAWDLDADDEVYAVRVLPS